VKIPRKVVETVEAKFIEIHAKVCDSGTYTLVSADEKEIAERSDYVPRFFPEQHYGDYLILKVELETELIVNWKKPDPIEVAKAFGLLEEE
jgi:hypothetical protein